MSEKVISEAGKKLKEAREKKEFTLRQLADHTGISWQKLTYCEKGSSELTKSEANKIARVLSVTTEGFPIQAAKPKSKSKTKGKGKLKAKGKGKGKGKKGTAKSKSKTSAKKAGAKGSKTTKKVTGKSKTTTAGTTKRTGAISVTGVKVVDDKSMVFISHGKEYHFNFSTNIKRIISKLLKS